MLSYKILKSEAKMTVQQLWSTFKKYPFYILILPLLILTFQTYKSLANSSVYKNTFFVTYTDNSYAPLGDIVRLINDQHIQKKLMTPKNTQAKVSVYSEHQFKVEVTAQDQDELQAAIQDLISFIQNEIPLLEPQLKKPCELSIRQLIETFKNIKTKPEEDSFLEIDTKIEMRTKHCIPYFRQASHLVNLTLSSKDELQNINTVNSFILNLENELIALSKLEVGDFKISIGEALTVEPSKKDIPLYLLNFLILSLFLTATLHYFKKNG